MLTTELQPIEKYLRSWEDTLTHTFLNKLLKLINRKEYGFEDKRRSLFKQEDAW